MRTVAPVPVARRPTTLVAKSHHRRWRRGCAHNDAGPYSRRMRMETALPCDPRSVGAARRFVTTRLVAWGHPALTDTAALLVSELVTNALLHAGSAVSVAVSDTDGCVRVEVSDTS